VAAFPTVSVVDNCNRTESPINNSGLWDTTKAGFGGSDGKLKTNGTVALGDGSQSFEASFSAASYGPDTECYCDVPALAASGSETVGFYLRTANGGTASATGYEVEFDNAATLNIKVWKATNSTTFQQLGSSQTQTISANDSLGARIVGNTIEVWYKASGGSWTMIYSVTDSTYTAAGPIAVETQGTTANFDNFGFGTAILAAGSAILRITNKKVGPNALRRNFHRLYRVPSSPLNQTYQQSLTADLTFVGSASKQTSVPLAGVLSFTGAISRFTSYVLTGVLSFAGSFVKTTSRSFTGSLSFTGAMVKIRNVLLTGALSFTGSISRVTSHGMTGALSFTGGLTKLTQRSLVAAALSFTGTFSRTFTHLQALTGSLNFTGTFTKLPQKNMTAGLSFTGALTKLTRRTLTGAILSFTGGISKMTLKGSFLGQLLWTDGIFQPLGGSDPILGVLQKTTLKNLTGGLSFTGALSRRISHAFTAVLSFTGNMVKTTKRSLTGGLSFTGAFSRTFTHLQALTASLGFSGSVSRVTLKQLTAGLSFTGATSKLTSHAFTAALSFAGSLRKTSLRSFTAGLSFTGSPIQKIVLRPISASISFSGVFTKRISRSLTGGLSFTGTFTKTTQKNLTASISFIGQVSTNYIHQLQHITLYVIGAPVRGWTATLTARQWVKGLIKRGWRRIDELRH